MSEQTQAAAQPAQPASLTVAQAAQKYAEAKANGVANPVSEAARTLGQRAAAARLERTTQAAAGVQENEQQVEDEPALSGEPLDNTVTTESPEVKTAGDQDDPESGTIDLGEGVNMTKDEIRESLLLLRQAFLGHFLARRWQ